MADMISRLPDSLISQILLYLPTKEAVRTSVLSDRWKSVWLLIPKLDLDSSEFPDYSAFVGFMEKFLNFSREEKSCLYKLKLSIQKGESDDHSCVTRWIDFVATPKLKHLEVEFGPVKRECLEVIPLSLYICETLLFLKLHRVFLGKFESVSLPCLKTMRLELNVYANETGLDLLISSCPVLEDLIIVRRLDDNVKVLRVRSQTLTSLSIEAGSIDDDVEALAEEFEYKYLRVLIDTHRLKYLNLEENICEFDILSNLDSLTKINICGAFYLEDSADEAAIRKRYVVRNFFTSILGIRDMQLSWETYEFIMPIKLLSLQFCNLSCLELQLYLCTLKTVPEFLKRCPNLKSLILDLLYSSVAEQTRLSSVPRCLRSSLEFVEIKLMFHVKPIEMELGRYFAKNSVILKKLVIRLEDSVEEDDQAVLIALLTLPRRSRICKIEVIGPRR